jgi:uncharacterized protein
MRTTRTLVLLALALLVASPLMADDQKPKKAKKEKSYDKKKKEAKPTKYVIGLVTRGPKWQVDSLKASELQQGHTLFLNDLRDNGSVMYSGSLVTDPMLRGLYVFNVNSIEKAKSLMKEDPASKAGWINIEYHEWLREYETEDDDNMLRIFYMVAAVVVVVFAIRTFRNKDNV